MTNKEKSSLQKEILDSLDEKPHGRLILAPRSGKTKLVIDLIKRDKPDSILWVTPSSELADIDIPNEFDLWKAKKYKKILQTTTWASLNKITGSYDLIVLDEEQSITENNACNLLDGSLNYGNIVSMTGTATRHQDKIDLYKRLDLSVLINLSINKAVDIGLLANYDIKVIECEMSNKKDIEAGNAQKRFMTSEKMQYEYLNTQANQAIRQRRSDTTFRVMARMRAVKNSKGKLNSARSLVNALPGRKLIFAATIDQSKQLSEHLYNSKTDNKDLKSFQSGEIDTIAMVNSGGIGFTYKELDHLVIVQCDSDKNGLTSQKITRTLLQQGNYKATVWIICLKNTQDETWVKSTLKSFDSIKITYHSSNNFQHLLNDIKNGN